MVNDVRTIEQALGMHEKCFLSCEASCYGKLGKSIVATRNLEAGTSLSENDITLKVDYPKGIPAKNYNQVLGTNLLRRVNRDQSIPEDSFSQA